MKVSSQLHLRRKNPWYPLDKRLGGQQSQSRRSDKEKKYLLCPCQESNPGRPTRSLVTVRCHTYEKTERCEAFTAVKIQVNVL